MRIIISHDVDHFRHSEHWRDLIVPKYLARMGLESLKGSIGPGQVARRLADILRDKREHLLEVLAFDNVHNIRPTFFIGMGRGMGLSYSAHAAARWVRYLAQLNCDLGIHGISYNDINAMRVERERFAQALGREDFGVRMHYLRQDGGTIERLAALGYLYDTTGPGDCGPWRTESGMWIFPLHVMDGWYLLGDKRYQSRSTHEAYVATRDRLDALAGKGVDPITINFHDSYFSPAHASWKEWYERVIDDLSARGAAFITYPQAIESLDAEQDGETSQ